jgi:RNA polymerase sigma factor (sigma-70 family)
VSASALPQDSAPAVTVPATDTGVTSANGAHPDPEPDPVAESPQDAEEAQLVADFRAGDVAAFEQIYRLHHRYVQLQARRVIADPYRAEDIAQEAFLRLTRQLQGGDGQIRLRAWLHRTTTNLAIDEHRRAKTRQQYQEQGSPLDELQNALERHDDGHPERMAEQSEVRATILEVIAHLPLRYRRILALRELDGLDYPSIAVAMGISVSAVESLLFRARRRFTQVYEELTHDVRPRRRRGRAAPAQG